VGKATSLPLREEPYNGLHWGMLEAVDRSTDDFKHYSLLRGGIRYDRKYFIIHGPQVHFS
jgi:hypothetical protein